MMSKLVSSEGMQLNFIIYKVFEMDLQLKDKVIIVTGGAKGIGEGIVKVLATEGAIPFIVGRSEEDNLKTAQAVEAAGDTAGDHRCALRPRAARLCGNDTRSCDFARRAAAHARGPAL